MNRSYSKIRHIQEANQRLEKRVMSEQFSGEIKRDMPSYETPVNINEQTSKDVGCLLSAGYKKETIGGPMVRREVYTTKKNGLTYYFDIRGGVRVFNRTTNKTGKWVCESKKIKLVGMKETPATLD